MQKSVAAFASKPQTTRYFVGIGSNIRPKHNTPLILSELQRKSPILHISRIAETAAIDMIDSDPFYNFVAVVDVPLDAHDVKQWFNAIEARLGRDRSNPLRGQLGRPADLDIILALDDGQTEIAEQDIPPEDHLRPMFLELVSYLNLRAPTPSDLPDPAPIIFQNHKVGLQATTLKPI